MTDIKKKLIIIINQQQTNKLRAIMYKIHSLIKRRIKLSRSSHFVPCPIIMELLHAVQRQRLVIEVEFIRKQFRSRLEKREVTHAEYAHLSDPVITGALEVERPVSPVLEASKEDIPLCICFWKTCHREMKRILNRA